MNPNSRPPNSKKFSFLSLLLDGESDNGFLHMMNPSSNIPSSSSNPIMGLRNQPSQISLNAKIVDHIRRTIILPNKIQAIEDFPPLQQHLPFPPPNGMLVTEVVRRTTTHFPPQNSNNFGNPLLASTNNPYSRGLSYADQHPNRSIPSPNSPNPWFFYERLQMGYQVNVSSFTLDDSSPKSPPRKGFMAPNEEAKRDGGDHQDVVLDLAPMNVTVPQKAKKEDNKKNPNHRRQMENLSLDETGNASDHNTDRLVLHNYLDPWLNKNSGDDPSKEGSSWSNLELDRSSNNGPANDTRHQSSNSELNPVRSAPACGERNGENETLAYWKTSSLPRDKECAYKCPKCGQELSSSQVFASHVMEHYRKEPREETKRRHVVKHRKRKLQIVNTPEGITIAPELSDDEGNNAVVALKRKRSNGKEDACYWQE